MLNILIMTLYERLSNKPIIYDNNKGYRQCLRELFEMDQANYQEKVNEIRSREELDEETEDEVSYDDSAAEKFMDEIYEQTKDNVLFKNLYKIAASRFLSEDESIGLVVVFSYDFMSAFMACLVDYLKSPDDFNKENNKYIALLKKIS
jgi:hypothetical protein